jgi:hypothetical protein
MSRPREEGGGSGSPTRSDGCDRHGNEKGNGETPATEELRVMIRSMDQRRKSVLMTATTHRVGYRWKRSSLRDGLWTHFPNSFLAPPAALARQRLIMSDR